MVALVLLVFKVTVPLALSVVNAPAAGVVAPTVPLILIEAVPVRLVTVPEAGVPRIAPLPSVATPVTPRVLERVVAPVTPRVLERVVAPVTPSVPPIVALPTIAVCASTMSVPLHVNTTFFPLGTRMPV